MKQLFRILISMLFLLPVISLANILDIKISPAQIFDVQWNISGTTFNASNFTRPFYSVTRNGTSCNFCQMSFQDIQSIVNNNQYFGFFESTTNPDTYGLAVYNQDGTQDWVLHNTGSFRALSADVVFYKGNGFWGTLITLAAGYNYGDSATFENITNNPTNEQLATFTPASTDPLAAGETAAQEADPDPIFSSGITSQQQTRKDSRLGSFNGNSADITIQGNNNTVELEQRGAGHYLELDILGNSNTVTSQQLDQTGPVRHYQETIVQGNSNTVTILQSGSSKTSFINILGSANQIDIAQTGSGAHFLDLQVNGNHHSVDILQDGTGNHSATIDLTELDGSWTFKLEQKGSTPQVYSLPHDLTDGTVEAGACYSISGCTLEIFQQ